MTRRGETTEQEDELYTEALLSQNILRDSEFPELDAVEEILNEATQVIETSILSPMGITPKGPSELENLNSFKPRKSLTRSPNKE